MSFSCGILWDLRDTVTGDAVEPSIRADLERGYELPGGVWVTSLEGRRIKRTKTLVVDATGQEVGGQYEGVVGLNNTHMPFLYDPKGEAVQLGEPLDSKCMLFGGRSSWDERRMGLEKVESKVPYDGMKSPAEMGERLDVLARERRGEGAIGDSVYALEGRVSDAIGPHLATVIGSRLVKHHDGLVAK